MESDTGRDGARHSEMPPEVAQMKLERGVRFTRTGRISKAKKGLQVHSCECGRSYTRAEHLRRHMKNHVQNEFVCDFPNCEKRFYRLDLLQRHQERHNELVPAGAPNSPALPPTLENSSVSASSLMHFNVFESPDITWKDPFEHSPGYSISPDYSTSSEPIPGIGDYANMFANPPYGPSVNRARTSSNASFIEPWAYPSGSPSSPNSTMAYTWTTGDKLPSAASTSSVKYAESTLDGINHMDLPGTFGPKSLAQRDEELQQLPAPVSLVGLMSPVLDANKDRAHSPQESSPVQAQDQGRAQSEPSVTPVAHKGGLMQDPSVPAGFQEQLVEVTDSEETDPSSSDPDSAIAGDSSASASKGIVSESCSAFAGVDETLEELKRSTAAIETEIEESRQNAFPPEQLKPLPPPVPSDSGYRSGLGTDTASVCSMDSMGESLGLPRNFLQDFIAFFGDTLIEKAGARQWATYTLATQSQDEIEKRLNTLLKDYTVDLASKSPSCWRSRGTNEHLRTDMSEQSYRVLEGATNLIRRYRPKITRYFRDNAVSTSANDTPLSVRLQNLGQQLSLTERFALFARPGLNNLDSDEMTSKLNAEQEMVVEDDDDDLKLFADLEPIRDMLVSSDAFGRMALNIRRMLYHDDTHEMENIRKTLKASSPVQDYSFYMDWTLAEFMRRQYGENFPSIGSVIAITGSALYAQATTCKEYIKQTWPKTGTFLMHALDAVLENTGSSCTKVINESKHLGLKIRIETTSDGRLSVHVEGRDEELVIELAQQLAWLRSTLSISPFGDQMAYARAVLSPTVSKSQFDIRCKHEPLHDTEMPCWLPLFSGAVIASGFPIPERADEMGLEIPLELLAGIAGVQHAVEFQGGVVMKGFSHMFVPIRKTDDRVQWHAVSSTDPDALLTYQDGLSRCNSRALSNEVSLDDIKNCRAIVGWCSVAQSRLGSDQANYENIHYSTATDMESSIKCAGGSVGFQQFGTAALDFKFGLKEGKCHFKRDGPFRKIVSWADKTPIVLYDTAERRGWLVSASDVMLHIAQSRHRLEPFEADGKYVKLDTNVSVNSSAKEILLKNMAVRLSDDDDDYTFKTEIANIWSILDFLIAENVAREQRSPGATINGTWCDVLNGFEFNAVVEQHSPFRQKQTKLSNSNGGWPLLSRDIDALVLFANGFEDIIIPATEQCNKSLCRSWQRVPKGKDYLATSTPLLKKLYERAGCPLDRKYLTSTQTKLQWHQGSSLLFDPCADSRHTDCRCNRLQQILPKSAIGTIVPPEHIVDQGAVIFGHSGSIVQDMISKPRAQSRKISGIYSQANVPLTPIITQQDPDDNFFSDGDTSGQCGSDMTTDSGPGSLSSCTTISTPDIASHPDEAEAVSTFSPSKKRQRFPEIHFKFRDEENEEELSLNIRRKRLKSAQAENVLASSECQHPQSEPIVEEEQWTCDPPDPSSILRPLGKRNDYVSSKKSEEAGLAVRLAGPASQHSLRRQSGFYKRTDANY